jgi:hypothetical protein
MIGWIPLIGRSDMTDEDDTLDGRQLLENGADLIASIKDLAAV